MEQGKRKKNGREHDKELLTKGFYQMKKTKKKQKPKAVDNQVLSQLQNQALKGASGFNYVYVHEEVQVKKKTYVASVPSSSMKVREAVSLPAQAPPPSAPVRESTWAWVRQTIFFLLEKAYDYFKN
jgi:hypothetical protein